MQELIDFNALTPEQRKQQAQILINRVAESLKTSSGTERASDSKNSFKAGTCGKLFHTIKQGVDASKARQRRQCSRDWS